MRRTKRAYSGSDNRDSTGAPGTPRADGAVEEGEVDDEGDEQEPATRSALATAQRKLGDLMDSFAAEAFLVFCIVLYGVLMLVEVLRGGGRYGDGGDEKLTTTALALLYVFGVEVTLKTAAFGTRFLLVPMNTLDAGVVLAALVLAQHSREHSNGLEWRPWQLALRVVLMSLRLYRPHRLWREVHGHVRVRAGIETPVEKVIAILHDVRRRYALDEEGDQELGWVLHTVATGGLYVPILRDGGDGSGGRMLAADGKGGAVDRETENWIMSNFTPTGADAADAGGGEKGGGGGGGGDKGGSGGGGKPSSGGGSTGARNRRHTVLRSQSPVHGEHGGDHAGDSRRSTLAQLFHPHQGGSRDAAVRKRSFTRPDGSGGLISGGGGGGGGGGFGFGPDGLPVPPKRRVSLSVRQLQFALPDCAELLSDNELLRLNEKIDDFDYDVFRLDELSHGRSLFVATVTLFRKYELCSRFKLQDDVLCRYFLEINDGYQHSNAYHNQIHAADVLVSTNAFLQVDVLAEAFQDLDIFAALFAASIHDFQHPGTNNAFHIATRSPVATLYNDRSVLENHHLAASFQLAKKDGLNIFADMKREVFMELRESVVLAVLATDMAQHFSELAHFKAKVLDEGIDASNLADRRLLLKMAVHCADISNPAKDLGQSRKWSAVVTEEFFAQGDEERKLGLPISMFCDRTEPTIEKCQVGFINFIVGPLFTAWTEFFGNHPLATEITNNIATTLAFWEAQKEKMEAEAATAAAAAEHTIITIPPLPPNNGSSVQA